MKNQDVTFPAHMTNLMNAKQTFRWTARFVVLLVLFYLFFIAGTLALAGVLPQRPSEPGLVAPGTGFLIIGIANTLLVMALVLSSRWGGWKLGKGRSKPDIVPDYSIAMPVKERI